MAQKDTSPKTFNGQHTFELTITKETVVSEYQKVLQKVTATTTLPGFRKGKAPVALVEKNIQKQDIYSQILDRVLPEAYYDKIKELKITPIVDPEIKPKSFEEGKDWVFTVETASKPEVELGSYEAYLKKALTTYKKNTKPAKVEPGHEGHDHEGQALLTVIFDTLLKESKVEVAPLLISKEAKSQLSRLVTELQKIKLTISDFAKSQKKTEEELVREYEKTAKTNLELELILDKLVEIESPEVTDEELKAAGAPKGQELYAKYVIQKRKVIDKLKSL